MISLFDFCSIPWWLTWLLPFLLGLGIGWLLWSKYQQLADEYLIKISTLQDKITQYEYSLDECRKARVEAEGNVALYKGKMRELESNGGAVRIQTYPSELTRAAVASEPSDLYFNVIGTSRLQIIEGIGPKMEEVLQQNGIGDFASLASHTGTSLRDILNKYGDKYRIIDPNTWPQQASLAVDRKWNELINLQKHLDTGRSDTPVDHDTDSKLEKYLIKIGALKKWAQDDLKAVEGIGPKIETLLHNGGIHTWAQLSTTNVNSIQDILTQAGSRFQLADPSTWPQQAKLAAEGKWTELYAYQDVLKAGKDVG